MNSPSPRMARPSYQARSWAINLSQLLPFNRCCNMSKKKFLKIKYVVRVCKYCGNKYHYRPTNDKYASRACPKCMNLFWSDAVRKYKASLTPEQLVKYQARNYLWWKRWVGKHLEQRRKIALASYHRHKEEHREEKRAYAKEYRKRIKSKVS